MDSPVPGSVRRSPFAIDGDLEGDHDYMEELARGQQEGGGPVAVGK
jgi:hypothetical protein